MSSIPGPYFAISSLVGEQVLFVVNVRVSNGNLDFKSILFSSRVMVWLYGFGTIYWSLLKQNLENIGISTEQIPGHFRIADSERYFVVGSPLSSLVLLTI